MILVLFVIYLISLNSHKYASSEKYFEPLNIHFEARNKTPKLIYYFFNVYFDSQITTYINVWSRKQKMPFYININTPYTYIASKDSILIKGEPKYNEQISNTLKN